MRASTLFLDSAPNKTSFEEAANCSVENFLECAAMHEYILASQVDSEQKAGEVMELNQHVRRISYLFSQDL